MGWHCVLSLSISALLAPSDAISVSSTSSRRGTMLRSETGAGEVLASTRSEHLSTLTSGEDYRCAPSGIPPVLMGVPGAAWADTKKDGYCYYLGDVGESCAETCMRQMGGACNAAGTEAAANNAQKCQSILQAFSNSDEGIGHTVNVGTSQNDRSGCTWIELAPGASRVEVFQKDGQYPYCSTVNQAERSHRVCACTMFFGSFGMYNASVGNCRASAATELLRKGVYESRTECEDECTRDSKCGAFAFVDNWDSHPRQCHFYGKDHVGDGANKYISCWYKKDIYLATLGHCKKHFGKLEEKIAGSDTLVNSIAACKAACDANAACEAFDVSHPVRQNSSCTFYGKGHTGNGLDPNVRCYTRATGGVATSD